MIAEHTPEKQRYYLVDLMRFAAAMMVVFYHFSASGIGNTLNDRYKLAAPKDIYPELFVVSKYGFIGVHLFFLISGFVILASALNRTAIEFAISRWTRLYPTFWCALTFTTLVLLLFLGAGFDVSPIDFLANMTLVNDYLGITDIDPVYWTLHVELQFYGCIFLLILAGAINRYQIWLGAWMLLVISYAFFRQPFFYALVYFAQLLLVLYCRCGLLPGGEGRIQALPFHYAIALLVPGYILCISPDGGIYPGSSTKRPVNYLMPGEFVLSPLLFYLYPPAKH